uniref:MADS-box transcription factor family protein n=1 Tax=Populus alba TaxID=43335 RepID=A0A4U5N878_POPAL|nr:MADS-box transcription factor family protein [Populus alba]
MLIKEIAEKNRELRHMRGEDLQVLSSEELKKLEKLIEGSLRRLVEEKEEKSMKEIDALKAKGEQLAEENQRLKQQVRLRDLSRIFSPFLLQTLNFDFIFYWTGDEFISSTRAFARTRPVLRFFSDQYQQYELS